MPLFSPVEASALLSALSNLRRTPTRCAAACNWLALTLDEFVTAGQQSKRSSTSGVVGPSAARGTGLVLVNADLQEDEISYVEEVTSADVLRNWLRWGALVWLRVEDGDEEAGTASSTGGARPQSGSEKDLAARRVETMGPKLETIVLELGKIEEMVSGSSSPGLDQRAREHCSGISTRE